MHMETEKAPQTKNPAEITLIELAELVKQMRLNQRRYFRFRKPEILETCKAQEKQVDEIVAKLTEKKVSLF